MRNRVWYIGAMAWCGAMLCLPGCGNDNEVAGSSMETENSIALSVQMPNGKSAARMHVIVRPDEFLAGAHNVDSSEFINAMTDDDGVLTMKTMGIGNYTIEARDDSLKGFTKIEITKADTGLIELPIKVKAPGSLKGQVLMPEGTGPVTVSVRGMDYSVTTDSAGSFNFKSLPEGEFDVVAFIYSDSTFKDENGWESNFKGIRTIGTRSAEVTASKSAKLELGEPETTYTMFEDFEDGIVDWYTTVSRYATAKLTAEKDRDGMVAHFVSKNDSAYNWALMGYAFKQQTDFSDLDSVVFWAKGNNYISLAFDVNVDSTSDYETGKAWVHLELDSAWKRYCVRPKDLIDSSDTNGGNLGWNAVKTHVTNLSFFSGPDDSEFWLDDVEIFGIKKSKLK